MKLLLSILLLQTFYIMEISAQVIFKPTSATINDTQGSYTSQNFDCVNMVVSDSKIGVLVSLAGEIMKLSPNYYNNDVYICALHQGDAVIKTVAYRSSILHQIYLITLTAKQNNQTITINFKRQEL